MKTSHLVEVWGTWNVVSDKYSKAGQKSRRQELLDLLLSDCKCHQGL